MDNSDDFKKRIDSKLDKIQDRLESIDVTLVKQHAALEKHIYRTDLAEKRLELVENELLPLKKHVVRVADFGFLVSKSVVAISILLGIVVSILKLTNRF